MVFLKHFKSTLPFVVDFSNLEVGFDSGWLHRFWQYGKLSIVTC